MSVCLFGQIFPRVANKHRLQVLQHFSECIKQAKAARQEAVQMNLFTALLGGLRGLTEAKANFNQEDVQAAAVSLIIVRSQKLILFSQSKFFLQKTNLCFSLL